jgi:hypothetical protein
MVRPLVTNPVDSPPIAQLRAICDRLGLGYTRAASVAGCGPDVVRRSFETGRLPDRASTQRRIIRFVELNANAASVGELRCVP